MAAAPGPAAVDADPPTGAYYSDMAQLRISRTVVLFTLLASLAVSVAGCDTATPPTAGEGGDSGCDHWCGNGSASVTIGGATTTISGGGCVDTGATGYDIRFGDWQGLQGISSYVALTAFRVGGATPTPAPTSNPQASPGATDHASALVTGSVGGNPFVLGNDTIVTLNADGTGSFSGTDVDGAGLIKGTYRCN